jgi:hemerythrin-like metal-binding protein
MQPRTAIPVWTPSQSVANAELDEQHITLLELGRNLVHLLDRGPAKGDEVFLALKDITQLSLAHDQAEEWTLAQNGCPTLAEHRRAHDMARLRLTELLADVSRGVVNQVVLRQMLADWMTHHIGENDLPVKQYLRKPAAQRPR